MSARRYYVWTTVLSAVLLYPPEASLRLLPATLSGLCGLGGRALRRSWDWGLLRVCVRSKIEIAGSELNAAVALQRQ